MHRAPRPRNTGVSHGSSTETPESLSLLPYKGLKRVPEGLSCGTHTLLHLEKGACGEPVCGMDCWASWIQPWGHCVVTLG